MCNGGIFMADDFSFKVVKELGVLSENKSGWKLELNVVNWNNRGKKYDIRSWSPEHEKMGKGVTLTKDELLKLKTLLNEVEI